MKVKLLKNHRHSGINYVVNDVIDVDAATAEWLANQKVATPAGIDTEPVVSKAARKSSPKEVEKITDTVSQINPVDEPVVETVVDPVIAPLTQLTDESEDRV